MSFRHRVRHLLWFILTPFFLLMRKALLASGILRHNIRQEHVLGRLAPGRGVHDLRRHLYGKGFRTQFIAWVDKGEMVSTRKLDGYDFQYHFRIFEDGEVRGHYEKTPERHPIDHFLDRGMEARSQEFLAMLGDWVIPVGSVDAIFAAGNTISQSAPATSRGVPTKG